MAQDGMPPLNKCCFLLLFTLLLSLAKADPETVDGLYLTKK